jgi:DNA-binding transcriptional MerR regulator
MSVDAPSELLSIGAFARASRLSLKALRLYDELGLLAPAHVDPTTGYRYYTADQSDRARLIGLLRRLDMPLARIGRVLELPGPEAAREIAAFWRDEEATIAVRRRLVAYLQRHLEARGEPMYDVATRDVPAQEVLSITRAVVVRDLRPFLMEAYGELAAQIGAAGASRSRPWFVIYHGEVNEDSDGPVEVCMPFDGSVPAAGEAVRRVQPAHREAYTTITCAQCEFPGILEAYEAVESWIKEHGAGMTASPREVYFAGEAETGADDPFCDVAYPIEG